ncbi:hypothetical protein BU17DRAFT_92412 [Hysterangium stoloniferum]|nr:hypothetical protein BU17DRAFT_92412 [Hysterangium stoloniferum]
MIARTVLAVFAAATTVAAWPIVFYPTQGCHGKPIAILHEPKALAPGKCGFFHDYVKSYSGATEDEIQKVFLYFDHELCYADGAHRMFPNATITSNYTECTSFSGHEEILRAYTFIEEFLPVPGHNFSTCGVENYLCSQN